MTPRPAEAVVLQPRDPIVVRDARPFGADPGARAFTLDWPLPRTVAGAIRTHIGETAAPRLDWNTEADRITASRIRVEGPLLLARFDGDDPRWTVYLPAPRDAVLYSKDGVQDLLCLRPWGRLPSGAGYSRPAPDQAGLRPVVVAAEVKPETGHDFWALTDVERWLLAADRQDWNRLSPDDRWPRRTLGQLPQEARTHVAIDRDTLTNTEGALFTTVGLAFREVPRTVKNKVQPITAMLCRVTPPDGMSWTVGEGFVPLGGERRMVGLSAAAAVSWPGVPQRLRGALDGATRVRLQLVTPAIFAGGWRPGWLDGGKLPSSLAGLRPSLIAAVVSRRIGVSGWNLAERRERATRYAVPAGSVYFLELKEGLTTEQIDRLWLGSVCDRGQDRRDGFGLVVPGAWESEEGP